MAEKKTTLLLEEELTLADCLSLGQTMNTAGFEVLTRIYEAAVLETDVDVRKLDPEGEDYERKLSIRTQRARNAHELVSRVRACALVHVNRVKKAREIEEEEAQESVANRFGISPSVKGADISNITKTFGIHPAKPKKA